MEEGESSCFSDVLHDSITGVSAAARWVSTAAPFLAAWTLTGDPAARSGGAQVFTPGPTGNEADPLRAAREIIDRSLSLAESDTQVISPVGSQQPLPESDERVVAATFITHLARKQPDIYPDFDRELLRQQALEVQQRNPSGSVSPTAATGAVCITAGVTVGLTGIVINRDVPVMSRAPDVCRWHE